MMKKNRKPVQKWWKDPIFWKFMIPFLLAALGSIGIEVWQHYESGMNIDRALTIFAVASSIVLLCFRKRHPTVIRGCCLVLVCFAMVLAMLGPMVEYELIPCAWVLQLLKDWGLTFAPVCTIYSALCSAMLSTLPDKTDEKKTPGNKEEKKEEETK